MCGLSGIRFTAYPLHPDAKGAPVSGVGVVAEPKKTGVRKTPEADQPPGGAESPPRQELGGVTKVSAYRVQQQVIKELSGLLDKNQEDTLLRYLPAMEADLLRLMKKREAELLQKKATQPDSN